MGPGDRMPFPEGVQGQLAVAAALRQRLKDFEHLKPRGAVSGSTRELLTHWRSKVSCQEELTAAESAQVLQALLRGERHVAELQRAEASRARRWDAMTQEAQLLAQKIKALRASAQSSRQRRAASLEAASRQRQELWRSCEGEEAARVLEELIQLDSERQRLLSVAQNYEQQLEKLGVKRRQAQRRLAKTTEAAPGEMVTADEVVDRELEVETLLWGLYHAEQTSVGRLNEVKKPSSQARQRSGAELPSEQLPTAETHPAPEPGPEVDSEGSEPPAPPPVGPRLASLIQRLSLTRDQRREWSRTASKREEKRNVSPVRNAADATHKVAENNERAAPQDGPWPALPSVEEARDVHPEPRPPDVIWGELPSTPFTAQALKGARPTVGDDRPPLGTTSHECKIVLEWDDA